MAMSVRTRDPLLILALAGAGTASALMIALVVTGLALRPEAASAAVHDACAAVVSSRRAVSGAEWQAARVDMAAAVVAMRGDRSPEAQAVRAYAAALLGAPTDGSGNLLVPAANACDRIGSPALRRELAPIVDAEDPHSSPPCPSQRTVAAPGSWCPHPAGFAEKSRGTTTG